jgi:N-acetylglucosamine-6-phosphate deacetylase
VNFANFARDSVLKSFRRYKLKIFKCGVLYKPTPEIYKTCVCVENGKIANVISESELSRDIESEIIDLTECIVGPGLVDLHCHGAMNSDFADGNAEDISRAAFYHLARGTTTLLAAVGSCTTGEMVAVCRCVRENRARFPNIYGVHFEGPYFNINYYGCHLAEMIRTPSEKEWKEFEPFTDVLKLVTIAPEAPGAGEMISHFSKRGVIFSIGHSNASYEEIDDACRMGLSHATHVFSAMPGAHRENYVLQPGVLETVLMRDDLSTEIIADGIHVGARLVEFVQRVKGTSKTAFISDALRGAGCPPGIYTFGPRNGKECRLIEDPRVGVVPDRPGILASSAITLSDCLKIQPRVTTLSLSTVWEMASLTPARILGIDRIKGSLEVGKDADFLVLDKNLDVHDVYLNGERVKKE